MAFYYDARVMRVPLLTGIARLAVFPGARLRRAPDGLPRGVEGLERLWLPIDDGRVEAWWLRARPRRAVAVSTRAVGGREGRIDGGDEPAPLVVFAHGNGELIDDWPRALAPYRALGMHLMLAEYRGYGRSDGVPSETAVVDDLRRLVEQSLARPDVDASRLVLHGRSLGGGVVCAIAPRLSPRAIVLWSTFTSLPDVARRFGVPASLVPFRFDNRAALRKTTAPVLVVHGTEDRLVPFAHAEALARVRPGITLLAERGADHDDCPRDLAAFFRFAERFLRHAGVLREASGS
jgi:alpha-beta hydrolase superfamily lysophospholipase